MIEVTNLTKRYDDVAAVDDISFEVQSGIVTGFLGPNGAGKSTTMRCILGLDRPDAGTARIDGRTYSSLPAPLAEVGALLEARATHSGRTARNHLLSLAQTHGIPSSRVDEVIDLVGLQKASRKRAGGFSMGMGQRLGIAAALLGDPQTLVLDEPVNGLDPEGIIWIRTLLKNFAADGRTVFLSSHLMSEMSMTAEHLIVIGRGKVLADMSLEAFTAQAAVDSVRVRSPQARQVRELLVGNDVQVTEAEPDVLEVRGLTSDVIGERVAEAGLVLHELTPEQATLEEAFMQLTHDAVDFHGHAEAGPARATKEGAA